jgi:hypothetical protein
MTNLVIYDHRHNSTITLVIKTTRIATPGMALIAYTSLFSVQSYKSNETVINQYRLELV